MKAHQWSVANERYEEAKDVKKPKTGKSTGRCGGKRHGRADAMTQSKDPNFTTCSSEIRMSKPKTGKSTGRCGGKRHEELLQ